MEPYTGLGVWVGDGGSNEHNIAHHNELIQ